jgi:hypothetical protein
MSTIKLPVIFRLLSVCLLAASVLTSCTSYGPRTIERDRMDYGLSINSSIKQQLLGNIVRLRYMEAPVFVHVSSIINQYALSGNVQAGVGFNNSFSSGDTGTIGAGGRWEDRPTITYSPISGREFSQNLMTPVRPESLFAMVQSGWPTELMFRLTVNSVNGLQDAHESQHYRKQADPRLRELLTVVKRLERTSALGMKRSDLEDKNATIILYVNDKDRSEQILQDIAFFRTTLQLKPGLSEYKLVYGLIPAEDDEIAVLTTSVLDMMINLAWQVDVPQLHIDDGRTESTFVDTALGGSLFHVHHSEEKPEDAYVAIKNRGFWFYIDDRDMITKRTFGVLQILLSLTEGGEEAVGPVISIGR